MQNTIHEPTAVHGTEAAAPSEATKSLKDETLFAGVASLIPRRASRPTIPLPRPFHCADSWSYRRCARCLTHHSDHSHQYGEVPCCKPANRRRQVDRQDGSGGAGTPHVRTRPDHQLRHRLCDGQDRRSPSDWLSGRNVCRGYLLPHHLPGGSPPWVSRHPDREQGSHDDDTSCNLVPATLSLEHEWRTRETSLLSIIRRIAMLQRWKIKRIML